MSAKIECGENEIVVFLDGEIDHHSASIIRMTVDNTVLNRRPKMLTLDFEKVTFMDSSGIGLIIGRYKLMKECGGQLEIRGPQPYIRRVLKLSGIERIVKIV